MNIAPALYENFLEAGEQFPTFVRPSALLDHGYNVNVDYRPQQRTVIVDMAHPENYRQRFNELIDSIITTQDRMLHNGTVLITGHASTHDDIYSKLIGGNRRAFDGGGNYVGRFEHEPEFCSASVYQRIGVDTWEFVPDAIQSYNNGVFANRLVLGDNNDEDEEEEEDGEGSEASTHSDD